MVVAAASFGSIGILFIFIIGTFLLECLDKLCDWYNYKTYKPYVVRPDFVPSKELQAIIKSQEQSMERQKEIDTQLEFEERFGKL